MIRHLHILLLLVYSSGLFAQIVLEKENLNRSLADLALIFEDADKTQSIEDILRNPNIQFSSLDKEIEILDFNNSRWYLMFSVYNPSNEQTFYLETARPITNRVDLFELQDTSIVNSWYSGDERVFNAKTFFHRKNIFPIHFDAQESKSFLLVLESDGEMISLPLIFWEESLFFQQDNKVQLFHGFYFGMLAVVIFIFFIFYLLLKEISFLYYVIYVFFQFMLQFSLEGFTFQYIFPNQPYWANNSILISAAGAVFFVLLYAKVFLKTTTRLPRWNNAINIILILILIVLGMSLSKGLLHEISYPIINLVSLFGTVSIIYIIISLKRKGYAVNNAFALGFILLIIGAVIFILGNLGIFGDAQVSELALKFSSGLEVLALSVSMAGKYRELQQEKELAQEKALEQLEQLVEERTTEVQKQKSKIEEQNKDIVDSIRYAQRIQDAILPSSARMREVVRDHFLFYRPRDIVSGDFYFAARVTDKDNRLLDVIAAVDCTGHGVPGAFMSFIGNNLLTEAIEKNQLTEPAEILNHLNKGLIQVLKMHNESGAKIRDGMDLSLCVINRKDKCIRFSGAKNGIYFVTSQDTSQISESLAEYTILQSKETPFKLIDIKGDKKPIGFIGSSDSPSSYHELEFLYAHGDRIFLYSDGYADQFGVINGKTKKFGSKKLKQTILNTSDLTIENQGKFITQQFEQWKGDVDALDDVILLGVAL